MPATRIYSPNRKKYKVRPLKAKGPSEWELRRDHVSNLVAAGIRHFLKNHTEKRACLVCNTFFKPFHRYHFLCDRSCRAIWHRGLIRPRKEEPAL